MKRSLEQDADPAANTAAPELPTAAAAVPASPLHAAKAQRTGEPLSLPTDPAPEPAPAEPRHISTFPLGRINPLENLRLEAIYVAAQRRSADARKEMAKIPKGARGADKDPAKRWGAATSRPDAAGASADAADKARRPKKKVALLMSYCGTGYQGMQINPDVPSIELDVHKALAMSGAVSPDNAMDPAKTSFMRCARTDKGVHAAGQLVSVKLIVEDVDIIERINAFLPAQIRVWGYARVPKHFHAKNNCDARIYEYLMPTYVLAKADPKFYPLSAVAVAAGVTPETTGRVFSEPISIPESTPEELAERRKYTISPEELAAVRAILGQFVGTHNFFNYTQSKKPTDKGMQRYITSFTCSDPFVREGIEWVSIKVKGQSFMLHQIRKMIGLTIMMLRTNTPPSLVPKTFADVRLNIPKAPALGLLLERPLFESYNTLSVSKGTEREKIDFDLYSDKIQEFKEQWIYKAQIADEIKDGHFAEWIRVVDANADDYGWYLVADGTISDAHKPVHVHTGPSGRGQLAGSASNRLVDGDDEEEVGEDD
ncbi:tRNA pseudouridine synthase 1 [Polyrhizophydium stewartii]|uniref:tRNA pseudouridine synthase 1 n=1 Tax=Polyrhizophydium stewartii TaxID=2732419 RepID=A0ABR4N0X9_9FUNG|nr:tRNA pseudouridine synthase 1 [Polyrhizophydium stewartii]